MIAPLNAPILEPDDLYEETDSGLLVPKARRRRLLRAADIFAGCGGFSCGMQQAGFDVVAAVEWNADAIATYLSNLGSSDGCAVGYVTDEDRARLLKTLTKPAKRRGELRIAAKDPHTSGWIGKHNPKRDGSGCRAMIMGDATKVTGDFIRATLAAIGEPPDINVVIGGPPCQGMSRSGRQRPDDPRNNLVLEFWRIADELGAEVVMMENVPPLLTEKKFKPLFEAIVERAHAAGFTITANVLDAVNYGVPQYRRRAFVVGTRGEANEKPFSFPMPTTWAFGSTPKGKKWSFLHRDDEEGQRLSRTKTRQIEMFDEDA